MAHKATCDICNIKQSVPYEGATPRYWTRVLLHSLRTNKEQALLICERCMKYALSDHITTDDLILEDREYAKAVAWNAREENK